MVTIVLLNVAWMCTTPLWTTRFSFFLKLFFLPALAGAFAMRQPLRLTGSLLLVCDRAAARTLAGTGVGVRPLAAHGERAAVAQTAIRPHFDVALDVERDLLAEIAFHGAFLFEDLADAVDLVFCQVANFLIEVDACPITKRLRTGTANAVDVSQADLGSLRGRQIHTGNTCHSLTLPLLMFGIDADDTHHALAVDHLALVANLFDARANFHV